MIRVAFRFDDPSSTSNHVLEHRVIQIFTQHCVKATVAVIPFRWIDQELVPLSVDGAGHLIEAEHQGVVEIALHGFSHELRGKQPNGAPAEFAGVDAARQEDWIRRGIAHLQGIFDGKIVGFVPPWNGFDCATLRAVKASGLEYVSAGWDAPEDCGIGVVILPRTCDLARLREAIGEARRLESASPMVIVVLHHFDFAESDSQRFTVSYAALDGLLSWLAKQPDVVVSTIGELAATVRPAETARGFRHKRLASRLHWRLQRRAPQLCFVTTPLWRLWWLGGPRTERGRGTDITQ